LLLSIELFSSETDKLPFRTIFVVDVVNEKRGPFGLRSKIVTVLSHKGAKTLKGAIHPFSQSINNGKVSGER